jgi:hypothetical protein
MVVRLEALPTSLSSAITAFFAIRLARKSSDRARDRSRFRLAQSECGRTAGIALLKAGPLKGAVVAFSESLTDKNGNLQAWLIGVPAPGPFSLKRLEGFDVTDAAALPDGGLIVLERRFRYSEGIKMPIRRIVANDLKPGATITGDVLLEATDALNIDSMEGIALHRSATGETILTLISDDNYSALQRTLLMQFAVPEGKPVLAEPSTR